MSLVNPPKRFPPETALHLSQQAPRILASSPKTSLPYPLSLFVSSETPELWTQYENLFLSCLRTSDDKSARICLDRLTERFGEENERIMALRGVFEEAVATKPETLEKILKEYEQALETDGANAPVRKRRIALLRSMGRTAEAIKALVELLDLTPTDAEAWAELSDMYYTQQAYSQAIFSLEEVMLITPNAWNIQARLGELLYISSESSGAVEGTQLKQLSESMRRFCRSIELCDNYLRGFYGLKISTKRLLEILPKANKSSLAVSDGDLPLPSLSTVEKLNELATSKLTEIVKRATGGEKGWDGYDESEIAAAKGLLQKDENKIER